MKIADLSHYQGTIDWSKARQELGMAIFRASVGSSKDNKYASYAAECGVPFGVYHYVKAGSESAAKQEAQFFYKCATVNELKPLFFVADIEYSTQNSKTTKGVTQAFAAELHRLGAKKLGLYISQDRYPYADLSCYDFIWIPRYGKNDGTANTNYKPKYPCDLWQYTDKGSLNGVKGNVDLNLLNSDKTLDWFISGVVASTPASKAIFGSRTLRVGSLGEDVKELQALLNEGFAAGLVEDGNYGNNTYQAVKKLQAIAGLSIDGIYGVKSHAALMSLLEINHQVVEEPLPEIGPDCITTLNNAYIYTLDDADSVPLTTIKPDQVLTAVLDKNNKPFISSNGFYGVRVSEKIGWIEEKNIK